MKQILTLLLSILSMTTFAQNWDEVIKAVASDREAGDRFGISVSISGDKAIIGACLEDEDASGGTPLVDAGSAYTFELSGGVWSQTAKLVASDRGAGDNFGYSVSISGDRAIVGAFLEDDDVSGGAPLIEAGSVYIFELNGGVWSETAKLVASDRGAGDRFGANTSISGNKVIVGAYQEDHDLSGAAMQTNAGAAYVFELSGGVWIETAKLIASDRVTGDLFGRKVSISGDKIIVGAFFGGLDASGANVMLEAGSAYIFELSGGVWSETAKLVASDRAIGDNFGFDVSISGDKAIVGAFLEDEDASGGATQNDAGSVYVFELSGGVWSETAKLIASDRSAGDYFGYSVSISGNKVIIGAYLEDHDASGGGVTQTNSGSVYFFELNGGVWSETVKLVASDRTGGALFGADISISGDRAIVGAFLDNEGELAGSQLSDAGSTYMFNTCNANPNVTVAGNTITANAAGTIYQWLDCDNGNSIISGETNQSYTATTSGSYAVIKTEGNCIDTSNCVTVTVVGVDDLGLTADNLKLYPNPTTGNITIDLSELENINVSIINSIGVEVFNTKNVTQNKLTISLLDFSNGIYFIKVQSGNEFYTQKIIKQ